MYFPFPKNLLIHLEAYERCLWAVSQLDAETAHSALLSCYAWPLPKLGGTYEVVSELGYRLGGMLGGVFDCL